MTTEDRLRVQQLINKYLKTGLFNSYTHVELADLILDKEEIPIAHRTLRRYISEERGESSIIKPYLAGNPNNVLVIGDTHAPFTRQGYIEHCREVQERFDCGTIVHIGDLIDNHFSSYHESDPDGMSASDELDHAIAMIKEWEKIFPKVHCCFGNHDDLITRKAFSSGLSKRWVKKYDEVLGTKDWVFDLEFIFNNVSYRHGTGTSGIKAAFNVALNRRQSVVQGHLHTEASVIWNVSSSDRIFAMQVGCGVDDRSYAMAYAKNFPKKYIVSCGVVLEGQIPLVVPMNL